jgi:hypothetical protein
MPMIFLTGQYSLPSLNKVRNKGFSYSVFIFIKYKKDVNHFLLVLLLDCKPF